MKNMKKKPSERINLYMDLMLYNEIKQKAIDEFLPIGTWTRQFIRKQLHQENNMKSKNETNG